MKRLTRLFIAVCAVTTAASALLAAPGQDRPGIPTRPDVIVQNRGQAEAVPVVIENMSHDSLPVRVEVMGTTAVTISSAVQTRSTRQQWEHRLTTVTAGQDLGSALAELGADGWEAVSFQGTPPGATLVLLKRPR